MAETKPNKLTTKKEKKVKERDSGVKAITTALKALPAEEQVSTLLAKYAEMAEENKRLQSNSKTVERQVVVLQRDKDQLETEQTKVILGKAKLESLCRELQKQNKLIKEENLARLREEEERRKEVSTKFNVTLSEISNLMKENSDKNSKLRDENQDMATRLQDLIKQYESREGHVQKMVKQKDLQCQLSEAKLAKHQIEMTEDKEKMLMEKKTLLEEVAAYQKKTQQMSLNEISLRTQLNSYMEKYEDFQKTLEKSNQIFNTFKKEMEEMAKKIKKTEKDTKSWKERWEGANKALLDMVTERSLLEKQLDLQVKQNKQLQNLCRALQQQLTEIRNKDKNKGEPECKDPEKTQQQESAVVEDSSVKETNSLETDACTVKANSLPVEVEVKQEAEGSSGRVVEDESLAKGSCAAAVEDLVEVMGQKTEGKVNGVDGEAEKEDRDIVNEVKLEVMGQKAETKVNGEVEKGDLVEVMGQKTETKVNGEAETEDLVEVMGKKAEGKVNGEAENEDRDIVNEVKLEVMGQNTDGKVNGEAEKGDLVEVMGQKAEGKVNEVNGEAEKEDRDIVNGTYKMDDVD